MIHETLSRLLRIPMEHKESVCSLENGVSFGLVCSVEFINIYEFIVNTRFLQKSQNGSTLEKLTISKDRICRIGLRNSRVHTRLHFLSLTE